MANNKDIFKIILLLQLSVYVFATYGHQDAEIIDFGSPTQPSRDEMIIEAAIKRGMDGEAVAELLRTKKPVVKTTTTPTGFTKTTTYKLEPDGSVSSKSILQKRHRYVYNAESIPDDIKNSPTGKVTRTFTDNDGNTVTQTMSVNSDKKTSGVDTDDDLGNWLSKPFPSWPDETKAHRTATSTFSKPHGDRTTTQSWSSNSEPETSFTMQSNTPNFRRTSTTTYIKPNGEKHVVQTTSSKSDSFDTLSEGKFSPIGDSHWPNFDYSTFSQPWDNLDPDNSEGWEVMKDPEVTTRKQFEPWPPKNWNWPEYSTLPTTTTTTTKPKLYIEPEPTTRKPLPSLDDFLASQYGQSPSRETTTKSIHTTTSLITSTPKTASTTTKFINIEDLPVTEVLHNGQPAHENILKTLPAHLTPRAPTERVLSVEHKHPAEEDVEIFTPKSETNIRTFSTTLIGPEKPKLKDLDPQIQDILKNAGIVPEIEGDSITKTRTEPDGRVITTTYKVNTVANPVVYTPVNRQHYVSFKQTTPSFNPYHSLTHPFSPIAEFLAQLGLTKFDITSQNGRYSKTIIDDNGDVLTATFVLTPARSVKSEDHLKGKSLE